MRGKMGKLAPLITKSKEIYENALDARVRVPPQVTSAEEWIVSRNKTTTALTLASATSPKHEPGIYSCSYDRLLDSTIRINDVCLISAKGLCSKMLVGPIADEEVPPFLSHPAYLFTTCTGCITA